MAMRRSFFGAMMISRAQAGALAQGNAYQPSQQGTIIYFDVPDIDAVFERTIAAGARILFEKKDIGAAGLVGEIEDS